MCASDPQSGIQSILASGKAIQNFIKNNGFEYSQVHICQDLVFEAVVTNRVFDYRCLQQTITCCKKFTSCLKYTPNSFAKTARLTLDIIGGSKL